MEDKLKTLIEGNSEANRKRWAMEWKQQGKKVIGVMSSYLPEEIIYAAGMLPWHITGTWHENISHALVYRGEKSCGYCNHVLESLLTGELNFLDGIVATDQDQELMRTFEVWARLNKATYSEIIHVPFANRDINLQFFTQEIRKLIKSLEDYWGRWSFPGVEITNDSLRSSIEIYNQTRNLLTRLYELRKREIPPLSGAEMLGIVTASAVMPKEEFNRELAMLLPYIESRKTNLKHVHPRLLITSEMLDNPAYLNLVEENCLIAMDDTDTGSRYFLQTVDTSLKDPVYALAKRYLNRPASPRMPDWDKQFEQMLKWIKEFNIDAVLCLSQTFCYPQAFRMPFFMRKFKELNIPSISLEREYHLSGVGQLRTRIEAFLEMLPSKTK